MGAVRAPGGGGREKPGWEHSGKTLNLVLNLFIYFFLKGLSIFCKETIQPEREGQPEVSPHLTPSRGLRVLPECKVGSMWV